MTHSPPDLPGAQTTDSPIDRALTLLLAEEPEAALRWSAAVVERDASIPSALVITCRLLEQMGRPEAAIEGLVSPGTGRSMLAICLSPWRPSRICVL